MADTEQANYEDYDEELYGDEEMGEEEEDPDLEEMKRRVAAMEEEHEKLSSKASQIDKQISSATDAVDEHSVYIGQVDYEATPEELRSHFSPCGTIKRVTILCDKHTLHPKGFAYVEFVDKASVENALKLDNTPFKGRSLRVMPKRQNIPARARGMGRGGRGRGRGRRGGRRGRGAYRGGGYRGGRGGYY